MNAPLSSDRRASPERLAPEPSAQTLRRIGVDVQVSKARGELALLGSVMRASPVTLSATLARIRTAIEIAERHLADCGA